MKYRYFFLIILLAALGTERLYYRQNGGFSKAKLLSSLPSLFEEPPSSVQNLLDQKFHFFGKGGTSFAFLGEDGKTVLKLFKHKHLLAKHPLFHIALPGYLDNFRIEQIAKTQKKQFHKQKDFFFTSCKLAYDELKKETGLIYLCLQPNPYFDKPLTLIDAWGFSHTIDLRQTEFALQQRADLFLSRLKTISSQEELKTILDALIGQIQTRCRKGIGDRDPNFAINFGLIGEKVIEFDLGSYYPNPDLKNPLQEAKELFFATHFLQNFLEKHYPEQLEYLLSRIAQKEDE